MIKNHLYKTTTNFFEICDEAGSKNLSNFNRQFRKYMATNPKTYQEQRK